MSRRAIIGMNRRQLNKIGGEFCLAVVLARPCAAMGSSTIVPAPSGTQKVGTIWFRVVDSRRTDPYLKNGSKRELLVRFWYPATPGEPCKSAPYTSAKVWNYLSQLTGMQLPQV